MRLPEEDHEALAMMAELTGKSMSHIVHEALLDLLRRYADDRGPDGAEQLAAQQMARLEKGWGTLLKYRST